MPLLAPVITTTLSMIFDMSVLFFSLFKNLLFTAGAPLNDGLRDFRNPLDQLGQKNQCVGAGRKIGTLPSPQGQENPSARRLFRGREGSDEVSLRRIRENSRFLL